MFECVREKYVCGHDLNVRLVYPCVCLCVWFWMYLEMSFDGQWHDGCVPRAIRRERVGGEYLCGYVSVKIIYVYIKIVFIIYLYVCISECIFLNVMNQGYIREWFVMLRDIRGIFSHHINILNIWLTKCNFVFVFQSYDCVILWKYA